MSRNGDAAKVSRRQFLAVAGTVAAASSFAVEQDSDSVQAPSHPLTAGPYCVTIDVTTTPISYSAKDGHGHSVAMHNNGLQVNPNDFVKWEVNTVGKKYHLTIMFLTTTPLVDPSNKPIYAVSGTESDEGTNKIGGIIGPKVGMYKYSVRALDVTTDILHPDDPTIIVGKGGDSTRAKLIETKGQLKEVRAQIESIENELGVIIGELKSQ